MCDHRLIRLTMIYQDGEKKLESSVLVALDSTATKKAVCNKLIMQQTNAIVKHLVMHWQYLLTEMNNMFYKIVEELPVQISVLFENGLNFEFSIDIAFCREWCI